MVTVFRAASVAEADIVAAWLDGHGIAAFVKDRFMAETLPVPTIVAPRGIGVCVAEEHAGEAKQLLEEHRQEVARRRELEELSEVHAVCETCRHVTPFSSLHAGTTQRCGKCGLDIEVPEA